MTRRWLTIILGLLTTLAHAQAPKPATDYFNQGSVTFIRESPEKALAIVTEGLVHYPENEPLIKLKELIEQQDKQDQQNQQNQQDQSQDQSKSDQGEQPPPEEQPEEKPDEPSEEEKDQSKKEDQQPSEPQDQEAEQKEAVAEDMTEEEAEMVLDSLRQLEEAQREQMTQEMIRRKMLNMPPVEKDW